MEDQSPTQDADYDAAAGFVQQQFARRAAENERTRLLIFGILGIFPTFGVFVVTRLAPHTVDTLFHGKVNPTVAALAWTPLAVYGFAGRRWVTRLERAGKTMPEWLTYVVSAVEVSLPTLLIALLFAVFPPALALVAPPVLLYPVFIVLSALRLNPRLCLFAGGVAALEYWVVSWAALAAPAPPGIELMVVAPLHHFAKGMLLLLCGVITSLAARRIRDGIVDSIERMNEKNRILDVFGKHVSPEVVNRLLAQRTGPLNEKRDVCVMFLDIRGFTKFSESKTPEEVVSFLNSLFDFMIDEITERGGIINKFLGDGFMAMFGAPISSGADCDNAVEAARAILRRVHDEVAAGALPPTRVGIALHHGPVITGQVGSRRRREYTIIGDVVNVTSRMEALNKEYGTELLLSANVVDQLGPEAPKLRSLGEVPLRGRRGALEIFGLDQERAA